MTAEKVSAEAVKTAGMPNRDRLKATPSDKAVAGFTGIQGPKV